MTDPLSRFRNPNGTYNGVKAMAEISGLSEHEIQWMWVRTQELRHQGLNRDAAVRQITEEARAKPWLTSSPTNPAKD